MWDLQHLTTLEASTASYGESFSFYFAFWMKKNEKALAAVDIAKSLRIP
jgi:hypothetical protein